MAVNRGRETTAAGRKSRELAIIRRKEEQFGNRPRFNAVRSAEYVRKHKGKTRSLANHNRVVDYARDHKGNYDAAFYDESLREIDREAFYYH